MKRPPLDVLHRLWMEGTSKETLAIKYGVSKTTVDKWVVVYRLPRRKRVEPEMPAPSPEDDAASRDSLALSPWVEARARECREARYASRRSNVA